VSRPNRDQEYAARIKAVVDAHGGRFTGGRPALIRQAGLTVGRGNRGIPTWLRSDSGTDGTAVSILRGPQPGVYAKTYSSEEAHRVRLRDDRSAYRKLVNAWTNGRATLDRIDPHAEPFEFADLTAEQREREAALTRLERAIFAQARDLGITAKVAESWFEGVPDEVRF
jgi:hypothetical protein